MGSLDAVLAELTAERLREAILAVVHTQEPAWRAGVTVGAVAKWVLAGRDLGSDEFLTLMRTIGAMAGQIEGMRYAGSSS